jgi:hypothetical protein
MHGRLSVVSGGVNVKCELRLPAAARWGFASAPTELQSLENVGLRGATPLVNLALPEEIGPSSGETVYGGQLAELLVAAGEQLSERWLVARQVIGDADWKRDNPTIIQGS